MYYQPDGVSLWYFKLRKLDKTELKVWDFKQLGLENPILLENSIPLVKVFDWFIDNRLFLPYYSYLKS